MLRRILNVIALIVEAAAGFNSRALACLCARNASMRTQGLPFSASPNFVFQTQKLLMVNVNLSRNK